MQKQTILRQILGRLSIIVLFSSSILSCVLKSTQHLATPTHMPQRIIGASSLDLIENWRTQVGVDRGGHLLIPYPFMIDGMAIVNFSTGIPYQPQNQDSLLTAYDLQTGQIVWQTFLDDPGIGTTIDLVYQGKKKLYLEYSSILHAFDIQTGKLLWSTPQLATHTDYWSCQWETENPLRVYSSKDVIYTIDSDTGEILSKVRDEPIPECIRFGYLDFVLAPNGLFAMNRETSEVVWQRPGMQPPYRQMIMPQFLGEDVIFQSGAPINRILRVKVDTGRVVWGTEQEYISTAAISGSKVYALREDGVLVALDLESGEIVGTVAFEGSSPEIGMSLYWVTADGPYVLVYFGDNQEIIVFEQTEQ